MTFERINIPTTLTESNNENNRIRGDEWVCEGCGNEIETEGNSLCDSCQECEDNGHDLEYDHTIDGEYIEDGYTERIERHLCSRCNYWEDIQVLAPIDYDREETETMDSGYN